MKRVVIVLSVLLQGSVLGFVPLSFVAQAEERPLMPHQPNASSADTVAEAWVARYNGLGNGDDSANDLAIDGDGSVFVTGTSWDSVTLNDYVTIKYDASGVEQWIVRFNGPGNGDDSAIKLAIDGDGSVFVTGTSWDSVTSNDYVTIKYDASGVEQWMVRYNGPGNGDDSAIDIAIDGDGNVYVTGTSWDSVTYEDYVTIKYNASGAEQWRARYNGPESVVDRATALAVDDEGSACVTGSSQEDYTTVKYDASGVEQWVARWRSGWPSGATDLVVDGSGNVRVTGSWVFDIAGLMGTTIMYDSWGVERWVAEVGGWGNALSLDDNGNVYVVGGWAAGLAAGGLLTVKYDSSGVRHWVDGYGGRGTHEGHAVALDGSGNIYVTGAGGTVKYNAAGTVEWDARFNGPGNGYDSAIDIAIDGDGNVFVTGTSWDSVTSNDYVTIKYIQHSTAVEGEEEQFPTDYSLNQNYPNPFNPSTIIRYGLPHKTAVQLSVFNTLGQQVVVLVHGEQEAGYHEAVFDAKNLASGVYLYRLTAGSFVETRKLVVVR